MEADERRERFDDLQLAFASVMASDKNGELSKEIGSFKDSLFARAGWKDPGQKPRSQTRNHRPMGKSETRERLLKGEPI